MYCEVKDMRNAKYIARWFLDRNAIDRAENVDVEGISNLKLQKLLYYAYGCYLALYGEALFEDKLVAWKHGPVVESIYHMYKDNGSSSIPVEPLENALDVTNNEKVVLEWVYNEFGQYTAWALRNMTHEEEPWKETEQNEVIPDELIKKYFLEHYVTA